MSQEMVAILVVSRGCVDEIIHEFNRPELMSSEYPDVMYVHELILK